MTMKPNRARAMTKREAERAVVRSAMWWYKQMTIAYHLSSTQGFYDEYRAKKTTQYSLYKACARLAALRKKR